MFRGLANFLTYNNIVPLTVSVVLVGASSTYAVNNPEIFYDERTEVVSIDNTYIANVNLDAFTPYVDILDVSEDDEFYYITYQKSTIELIDAVWQDIETEHVMRVRKTRLGRYGDLGMYVTEQLKQVIGTELERLRGTQIIERQNVTQKRRVTTYSGLLGARLNANTETIPGYVPRVRPPRPTPEPPRLALPGPDSTVSGPSTALPSTIPLVDVLPVKPTVTDVIDETPLIITDSSSDGLETNLPIPYLQLLGSAIVTLVVDVTYTDLGVAVIDVGGINPTVERYINDVLVTNIQISTTEPREYVVEYRLVQDGVVYDSIERQILVVAEVIEDVIDNTVVASTSSSENATSASETTTSSPTTTSSSNQQSDTPPLPVISTTVTEDTSVSHDVMEDTIVSISPSETE